MTIFDTGLGMGNDSAGIEPTISRNLLNYRPLIRATAHVSLI